MNRSILLLSFAGFFSAGTTRVCDALLPNIAESFDASIVAAAIAITAFTFAYGFFQLAFGPLGARIGPYRTAAICTLVSAVTTYLCAAAPSLGWLAAGRFLSGMSCAAIIPMSMAFIGDTIPYEQRQPVLARFLMGHISGVIAGQAFAGLFAELFTWREVFLVLGTGFVAVGGLLLLELRAGGGRTVSDAVPPSSPLLQYLQVLNLPWARTVLLTVTLEGFFCFGAVAYFGAYLRETFGLSYLMIGLVVASFGLGGVIFAITVRRLLAVLGEPGLAIGGGVLLCAAFLGIAVVDDWRLVAIGIAACGLGYYMLHNTLQTNATQMAPFNRSAAIALFAFGLFVGQAVGAVVLGLVLDRVGYGTGFAVAGVALLLIGLGFRRAKLSQPAPARA